MKKWLRRKSNCNCSSVQANFVKCAVYVPLSTYYKCTNLQVVKALVRSAAQPRMNTVILRIAVFLHLGTS